MSRSANCQHKNGVMTHQARCSLEPLAEGARFDLATGGILTLGRGSRCQLHDAKVSRNHAVVELGESLTVTATRKVFVQRAGGAAVEPVEPGATVALYSGDALFLLADKRCGFRVVGGASAAAPPSRKRKSPPEPAPALPPPPAAGGVFAGLHFCFWQAAHAQLMQQKTVEAGGAIDGDIGAATTHCVCADDMTPAQASARLSRRPHSRVCEAVTLQGARLELPTGVHFVTAQFVADSLLKQRVLDEDDCMPPWYVAALRQLVREREAEAADDGAGAASETTQALLPEELQAAARFDEVDSGAPTQEEEEEEGERAPPPPSDGDAGAPPGDASLPCVVERRGAEWVAVQGVRPRVTGGHTGIPWGTAGVWDEPCDEAAAR